MELAGVRPSRVTRAAVVIAVMAVGGGLARMLVSGWAARDLWGFVPDVVPACLEGGPCTAGEIAQARADAWSALVPGAVLAAAGLVLAVTVALLLQPSRPRRRGRRPVTWPRVAVLAGTVTLVVGLLLALPVLLATAIAPPLGAAATATGVGAVVLVLILTGRVFAPVQEAVVAAVPAAAVAVAVTSGCLWLAGAGEAHVAVVVTLLLTVPPAVTGVVDALLLRALARAVRRRLRATQPAG